MDSESESTSKWHIVGFSSMNKDPDKLDDESMPMEPLFTHD